MMDHDALQALKDKVRELKEQGFYEDEIKDAMRQWLDEVWYRDW